MCIVWWIILEDFSSSTAPQAHKLPFFSIIKDAAGINRLLSVLSWPAFCAINNILDVFKTDFYCSYHRTNFKLPEFSLLPTNMKQTQWGNIALRGVLFDAHKLTVQLKVAVGLFMLCKRGPDRSLLTTHTYWLWLYLSPNCKRKWLTLSSDTYNFLLLLHLLWHLTLRSLKNLFFSIMYMCICKVRQGVRSTCDIFLQRSSLVPNSLSQLHVQIINRSSRTRGPISYLSVVLTKMSEAIISL